MEVSVQECWGLLHRPSAFDGREEGGADDVPGAADVGRAPSLKVAPLPQKRRDRPERQPFKGER
jgi:hypothetical protein